MAEPRMEIILVCSECKSENYINTKNKKTHPERQEYKKFCPKCNKHTLQREKKK